MTRYPSEWGLVFDMDDTLLVTSPTFEAGVLKLCLKLAELGIPMDDTRARLERIDLARIEALGYAIARWPDSMGLAYRSFVEEGRLERYEEQVEKECIAIGWETYARDPEVKPGAREVLEELRPHARLVLATRGEAELQGRRLSRSGLKEHFDAVYFMERKNAATYGALLREQRFEPRTTFIIGDGMRSDINPALELGAHALLVRGQNWVHEQVPPVRPEFDAVDSLHEIPGIVLARMRGQPR